MKISLGFLFGFLSLSVLAGERMRGEASYYQQQAVDAQMRRLLDAAYQSSRSPTAAQPYWPAYYKMLQENPQYQGEATRYLEQGRRNEERRLLDAAYQNSRNPGSPLVARPDWHRYQELQNDDADDGYSILKRNMESYGYTPTPQPLSHTPRQYQTPQPRSYSTPQYQLAQQGEATYGYLVLQNLPAGARVSLNGKTFTARGGNATFSVGSLTEISVIKIHVTDPDGDVLFNDSLNVEPGKQTVARIQNAAESDPSEAPANPRRTGEASMKLINLPSKAQVTINKRKQPEDTRSSRTYTVQLQEGYDFKYTAVVQVEEQGRFHVQTFNFSLRMGSQETASFDSEKYNEFVRALNSQATPQVLKATLPPPRIIGLGGAQADYAHLESARISLAQTKPDACSRFSFSLSPSGNTLFVSWVSDQKLPLPVVEAFTPSSVWCAGDSLLLLAKTVAKDHPLLQSLSQDQRQLFLETKTGLTSRDGKNLLFLFRRNVLSQLETAPDREFLRVRSDKNMNGELVFRIWARDERDFTLELPVKGGTVSPAPYVTLPPGNEFFARKEKP